MSIGISRRTAIGSLFVSIISMATLPGCKSRAEEERKEQESQATIDNYEQQKAKMDEINAAQKRVNEAYDAAKAAGEL